MKCLMVKKLGGLQPIDEVGESVLRRVGLGEIISVDVVRPRNPRFHRKFFAMLQLILDNQEHYRSIDDLLNVCKLRIGHCRTIQTAYGEHKFPMSISFGAMDDIEFADFYDRACAWVCTEVIPGLQRRHLDEEVAAQLREFGRPEG